MVRQAIHSFFEPVNATLESIIPAATAVVGYRYAPSDTGVVFRVGFTPLLAFAGEARFLPLGGMSVGASF